MRKLTGPKIRSPGRRSLYHRIEQLRKEKKRLQEARDAEKATMDKQLKHMARVVRRLSAINERRSKSVPTPEPTVPPPPDPGQPPRGTDLRQDRSYKELLKIADMYDSVTTGIRVLPRTVRLRVSGKFVNHRKIKQRRLTSRLSKDLGVDRRSLKESRGPRKVSDYQVSFNQQKRDIIRFLCSPEHSYTLPGKKDTVTVGQGPNRKKVQKVVLTEILSVLHDMYLKQYPGRTCCQAFFNKVRRQAKYIKCVACNNTLVCLCVKHQNFALRLRAVNYRVLPDTVVRESTLEEFTERLQTTITRPSVTCETWQYVEVEYGVVQKDTGKKRTCKKLRLRHNTLAKQAFIEKMSKEFVTMREHSLRAQTQHRVVRELREGMSEAEVTIQMDFAENWPVSYPESPQSVYYSKEPVTLHPAVIHYKVKESDGTVKVKHKSLALVTDDRKHDTGAILAFMGYLSKFVQDELPNVSTIHYVSDSPSSQYRNRGIFSLLAKHRDLFGVDATWTYFEAGHGKGPCDGVGAAAKRNADLLVKRNHLIENAADFAREGNALEGTVLYHCIPEEDVAAAREQVSELTCDQAVVGTMKVHAAVPATPNHSIAVRDTSCFKPCCWEDNKSVRRCPGWTEHELFPTDPTAVAPVEAEEEPEVEMYKAGDFVACTYNTKCFIAEVLELNNEGDYEVSFMERRNLSVNEFVWNARKDICCVPPLHVLTKVTAPQPISKQGRRAEKYALAKADLSRVQDLFSAWSKTS